MANLFKNFGVKLAALLLAILLWFHVATEKVIQYEISLPLNQIDLANDLVLTEPPEGEIDVNVSATGKRLLQSAWKKSGLKLTVNRNITGRFKVDLNLNDVSLVKPDGVDLLEIISPRELTLNCDRVMETEVPVKSNVVIVPDNGFVLSQINTLMPRKVNLSGPRRYVINIDSVATVSEKYVGVRNDLKLKIPLVYPNYYGIKIDPDTVLYIVGVSPITSRVFENIAITPLNTPSDSDFSWGPKVVTVRIGGEAEYVDAMSRDDLSASADFSHPDSLGNFPVVISHPKELSVLNQDPETVKTLQNE